MLERGNGARPETMNTPAFTVIRTTRTAIEADLIVSFLRSAGMHPVDFSISPHFSLGGAEGSFPIEVPTTEAKSASDLLKDYDKPGTGA
jgi:hypothetical protein